jgi:hypothetical protein
MMKFFRELYKSEILPAFKSMIVSIIRGIKSIPSIISHVIENGWSSLTGLQTQHKSIIDSYQNADWYTFAHGLMLLLGALVIYDNPLKNWEVMTKSAQKVKDAVIIPSSPQKEIQKVEVPIEFHEVEEIEATENQVKAVELPSMIILPYEETITINKENFIAKIHEVANRLQIKPEWLMVVIWIESTFNRGIVNKFSGTVGLIQWTISNVCKFWNLRTPELIYNKNGSLVFTKEVSKVHQIVKDTSGVEQLEKVYDYLKPYVGRMKTVNDVYFAIFYPAAIGKGADFQLGSERSIKWMRLVYAGNKALDQFGDKDGLLEVSDVRAWVTAHIPRQFKDKI